MTLVRGPGDAPPVTGGLGLELGRDVEGRLETESHVHHEVAVEVPDTRVVGAEAEDRVGAGADGDDIVQG